jgi:hypothetical protein
MDARAHLETLVGREIKTVTGRPNKVLSVGAKEVMVAARTSEGKPVPIAWVQNAMDLLERDGEVTIDVETVGYRSAFVGAVLATLPGARVLPTSPPRIALLSPAEES